jgi:hypothetical protein
MHREFWEAGYRIFGVHHIVDGRCGCGNDDCKMAGKHPRASNWQHSQVWSAEQVEAMEQLDHFATGYGVLVQGLIVIDIDARNGGVASLDRLRNDFPDIERAGLVVATGSGNGSQHLYFKAPEGVALVQHHSDYPGIDFKSSGFVVGPGSLHKSGEHYTVTHGSVEDIDDCPQSLIDILRKPERHRAVIDSGQFMDVTHGELAEMVAAIDPDTDHETWIRCGMALHHATGGTAFDVWDLWSSQGTKYPGSDTLLKRWHSFGKAANPVTLGTLIHYAEANGWKRSYEFDFSVIPEDEPAPTVEAPEIDLRRPPGFVGEVAAWIEDQCYRPREHLAVAAALASVGNLVGLRYTDDVNNVSTNLFVFCVAGSGTGKEPVQSAMKEIHKAAGMHAATYSTIKSEQEIVRNMTRHQSSCYVIDEIGSFLGKVKSAQKNGGAIYLEGVIGTLMAVFTKSNSFYLLSGDVKEDVRRSLKQEYSQIEKQLDEGSSPKLTRRLADLKKSIETLDDGLERPFVSLTGFTNPIDFEDMVDFRQATNGFIGRSLLFHERETVPPAKQNFAKRPMPPSMANTFSVLFNAGEFDMTASGRVEHYGDKIKIPTTPGAVAMLKTCQMSFDELAYEHKALTGLEALALRGYEMVSKVSLILAVPGGVRTEEHVRWSEALVRRDIEDKMRLVVVNDGAKEDPAQALLAAVMNIVSGDDGETMRVIMKRLRSHKKEDVEKAVEYLVRVGQIKVSETVHRFNKSTIKKYRKA